MFSLCRCDDDRVVCIRARQRDQLDRDRDHSGPSCSQSSHVLFETRVPRLHDGKTGSISCLLLFISSLSFDLYLIRACLLRSKSFGKRPSRMWLVKWPRSRKKSPMSWSLVETKHPHPPKQFSTRFLFFF